MFKFIKKKNANNIYDRADIEMTIEDSELTKDEVLEYFIDFLKACGYSINEEL